MKKTFALFLCVGLFFSCGQKSPEMTLEEIAEYKKIQARFFLKKRYTDHGKAAVLQTEQKEANGFLQ